LIAEALEVKFAISRESKNIEILYAMQGSDFDRNTMLSVQNRQDTGTTGSAQAVVQFTTGFGSRGSAGNSERCSVVI
jgi:hypothetical protein